MKPQKFSGALAASAVLFCAFFITGFATADEARPASKEAREKIDSRDDLRDLLGTGPVGPNARLSDRMAESAKRLGKDLDAGPGTQLIQQRILEDLDALIDHMNKKRRSPKDGPVEDGPTAPAEPGDDPGKAKVNPPIAPVDAKSPGDKSSVSSAATQPAKKPVRFEDCSEVFMQISPRTVKAGIEGSTEQISPKYQKLTEDYYRRIAQAGK